MTVKLCSDAVAPPQSPIEVLTKLIAFLPVPAGNPAAAIAAAADVGETAPEMLPLPA